MVAKILLRIGAIYSLAFYITAMFRRSATYTLQTNPIGALSVLIFFVSLLGIWFFMFYNWGISSFNPAWFKKVWFFILLFGIFIGGLIYYILVYEFKLTYKND